MAGPEAAHPPPAGLLQRVLRRRDDPDAEGDA